MITRNVSDLAIEMREVFTKLKNGDIGRKQAAEQRLTLLGELKAYTSQHKHEVALGEGNPIKFFKNNG